MQLEKTVPLIINILRTLMFTGNSEDLALEKSVPLIKKVA